MDGLDYRLLAYALTALSLVVAGLWLHAVYQTARAEEQRLANLGGGFSRQAVFALARLDSPLVALRHLTAAFRTLEGGRILLELRGVDPLDVDLVLRALNEARLAVECHVAAAMAGGGGGTELDHARRLLRPLPEALPEELFGPGQAAGLPEAFRHLARHLRTAPAGTLAPARPSAPDRCPAP